MEQLLNATIQRDIFYSLLILLAPTEACRQHGTGSNLNESEGITITAKLSVSWYQDSQSDKMKK